jgi:hypothetical protein
MTNYEERLAKMQDEYDGAEARVSGGSVPDGEYEGLIERFDFWEKDGGGPLKLITEISVQQGDYAGMSAPSVWHELEDPERIGWTKGYLEQLGIKGVNLAELPKALEPLAGRLRVLIRVTSTSKGDKTYRNTYVNDVLDEYGPASGKSPKGKGKDDDDIPF